MEMPPPPSEGLPSSDDIHKKNQKRTFDEVLNPEHFEAICESIPRIRSSYNSRREDIAGRDHGRFEDPHAIEDFIRKTAFNLAGNTEYMSQIIDVYKDRKSHYARLFLSYLIKLIRDKDSAYFEALHQYFDQQDHLDNQQIEDPDDRPDTTSYRLASIGRVTNQQYLRNVIERYRHTWVERDFGAHGRVSGITTDATIALSQITDQEYLKEIANDEKEGNTMMEHAALMRLAELSESQSPTV